MTVGGGFVRDAVHDGFFCRHGDESDEPTGLRGGITFKRREGDR